MYMRQEFGPALVCIFLACYIGVGQYFPAISSNCTSLKCDVWALRSIHCRLSAATVKSLLHQSTTLLWTCYRMLPTEAKNQGDWWLLKTGGMMKDTDILTFVPHSPRQILLLVPHSKCAEDAEEDLLGHGIFCMMMVFTSSSPVWLSDSLNSVFLHHQHLGKVEV